MGDTSEYVVMYIFARLVASFNGPLRVDLVVLRLGLQMLGRAPIWIAERAGVWLSVC